MIEEQPRITRKIQIKNYTLPIFVVILFIQLQTYSHRTWEILFIALGLALALSAVWAYSLSQRLSFTREMRHGWAQVGDKFNERFILKNGSRLSALGISIIDHSDFPGYQASAAWTTPGRSEKIWVKGSACYTRGYFNVGPTDLITSDPFGVFEVSLHFPESTQMLVTPPIIPLLSIQIATGDWEGDGGTHASFLERTVTSVGVREYAPGDNLYSIHWMTSARRDDLFVRTFDKTPTSDWWIFLDLDENVQVGKNMDSTEEYAAVLAASIADRGLNEGRAVGLIAEGDHSIWLPPKTGAGQRWEIMYALAMAKKGAMPLKSVIAKTQRQMGRNSSIVIITPSLDRNWVETLVGLRQRGIVPTVLFLNPASFGGDHTGDQLIAQLAAWGVRAHQITPDIYERPEISDYFVGNETNGSAQTAGDLDWGKFR